MAGSHPPSPLATTARWIAAVRARESARPDRLFDDPYAAALAGARGVAMREASERAAGGENAFIPVRTRYFDDVLTAAIERGAVTQVVLLGAGMDTRAYRLGLPEHLAFYELDRAEVLEEKEGVLAGAGASPRCRRHALSVDLARPWSGPLRAAGFDPGAATVWLAEGLLFYLSDESVRRVLSEAAALSAAGSLIIADAMGTGVRSLPMMRPYLRWLAGNGLPPPFAAAALRHRRPRHPVLQLRLAAGADHRPGPGERQLRQDPGASSRLTGDPPDESSVARRRACLSHQERRSVRKS